jgi:hypothetical protein
VRIDIPLSSSDKSEEHDVAIFERGQYPPGMPYVFPHEELFVYTIATLIVVLLYMRVRIARRRRKLGTAQETESQLPH